MSDQPFPPADAAAFLGLCAGEWMSLRSSFELSSGGDDDWHSSERGELVVRFGEAVDEAEGELVVTAPGGATTTLRFFRDGALAIDGTATDQDGTPRQGSFCTDIRRVSKAAA